jgi:tetratricopeptide (TPR) repeat protein
MRVLPPGSITNRDWTPHAGELFTDRQQESRAFEAALKSFRQYIDRDDEVGVARQNIVAFHGLGGVGKTALSERLEGWVNNDLPRDNAWGPSPVQKVSVTARIDLHGSAGQIDMAAALVTLRAGAAKVRRRWPVFDLAFAAYWSSTHPGEPIPTFHGEELGGVIADTVGDILNDLGSVADLTTGTGVGLGIRGVRKIVGILRRRRDLKLAINAFAGFEEFLMRCADGSSPTEPNPALACEIAGALSWEISQISPSPLVLVFVDAAERLALDPRRVSEGYVNALIHHMPNVLFVMTGRDRLDWHDESRIDLPYRGHWMWPGLVSLAQGDLRQYLVGSLSPLDTRSLVERARERHRLPMSDGVVDELVKASHGLPQYLEVARQVAITVRDAGDARTVRVADVTGSLGSLVLRVLEDVRADERRAIRAASLFRIFDTGLMAAAAEVDHGCAERAVMRPMIDRHDGERFPYRMHDAVREAVRLADHQIDGGWSERDWQEASTRAAAALRRLHDSAKAREDNSGVMDAIGIAVELVCNTETKLEPSASPHYEDWLSRAIVYAPSVQGLMPRVPGASKTEYGTYVLDFVRAKAVETPIEERLRLLRQIFDSDHPLRLPAGRHLGYTLKSRMRWDEALAVFDEVVALAPTPLNIGQRPQALALARRFVDARDAAAGTRISAQVRRMVEYAHGRPERYLDEINDKMESLRLHGRQREYLEEFSTHLARRALIRGDLTQSDVERFRETAELAGHVVAIRDTLLAMILLRQAHPTDIAVALQQLRTLDEVASGEGTVSFRYALAEFCDASITGTRNRLEVLREEILEVGFRTRSWIPIECFLERTGLPLPIVPTQWIEPREVVYQRWTAHLEAYLARHDETRNA